MTAFSKTELKKKFEDYLDSRISDIEIKEAYPRLMNPAQQFENPSEIRRNLSGTFKESNLRNYYYRPFDSRWIYNESGYKLIQRWGDKYQSQLESKNPCIITAQGMRRGFDGVAFSEQLTDFHSIDPDAEAFPLHLKYKEYASDTDYKYIPNISDFYEEVRVWITKTPAPKADSVCTPMPKPAPVLSRYGVVRGPDGKPNALAWELAEQVFYHTLAVLSAPAYREEHAEYLAEDWPRVPLPPRRETLEQSAAVGRRVAALLDPQARPDLSGAVGRLVRAGTDEEAAQDLLSIGPKPSYDRVREVYVLSDTLELAGVPERVWAFTLGGYPVLKNWVEYRKGRTLTLDDAEWLEGIVRRVSALLDLGAELDAAYAGASALPG